ncbi:hypothetical protein HK096_009361, partial [Nowakowskiella sp. JEL0078]
SEEYRNFLKYNPTLLDVLYTFSSSTPTLSSLLSNLTFLQPRYYSLTTSPLQDLTLSAIAFNVVDYIQSESGRRIRGIASGYLEDTMNGLTGNDGFVDGFLKTRTGKFLYPGLENSDESMEKTIQKKEISIVCIGAGTGVAPFASFIRHRAELFKQEQFTESTIVISGRRYERDDALYRDIFLNPIVTELYEAKSKEESSLKKYVQDWIKDIDIGRRLWEVVNDGGVIYVCGGLKMAADLHESLIQLALSQGCSDLNQAKAKWNEFANLGQYVKEIW